MFVPERAGTYGYQRSPTGIAQGLRSGQTQVDPCLKRTSKQPVIHAYGTPLILELPAQRAWRRGPGQRPDPIGDANLLAQGSGVIRYAVYHGISRTGPRIIVRRFAMAAFIGSILGGFIVAVLAFITTRYTLLHSYDQTLRDRRLERYQELFHLTRLFHRYYLIGEEPRLKDLEQFRHDCDAWYFGKAAGGMFLTKAAKDIYMQMMNMIAEVAFENGKSKEDSPLTPAESKSLRQMASTLRHQLAADVGAANAPRLRWTRPEPTLEPPLSVERRNPGE